MLDDWGQQLGLKGSGSQSIRFDHGRVASHLVLEDTHMVDVDPSTTPGYALHGNPLYCGRALCVVTMSVAGLVVGGCVKSITRGSPVGCWPGMIAWPMYQLE
jgi:3-hydroxy-9,10-secoandrosta-1,3,5(10)-triene-9,17-dione monooxygenase